MQMSLSICINSIITAMEGGEKNLFYSLRQCYLCQLVWGGQKGGEGGEWACVCVRVCVSVLLEVCERRGRLLHHLARASCHIAENLTNSIVPLVSHRQTPSDRWCLNTTTWGCSHSTLISVAAMDVSTPPGEFWERSEKVSFALYYNSPAVNFLGHRHVKTFPPSQMTVNLT